MGLKILHSADWHMDSPFASFPEEQRAILRQEQLRIPGRIAEICRRENCDLVLLAGDLFDGSPSRDTVETVKLALRECGVPVFVAPGNHDFCEVGSPWLEERWPDNVHIFTAGITSIPLPDLNCRVWGAGYRSMDCPPMLENFRAVGDEAWQIGVLHADPITVRSPYCPVTAGQIRESGLAYLGLGHIHKAGMFRSGETLCAWPGCPMGRGWDETGDKGICIVTIEESAQVRFLPLNTSRFHELEADVTDGVEAALDALLPAAESSDHFRITLTGRTDADLEMIRRKYDRFPNLVLRDQTVAAGDIWEDAQSDTLRGIYFRLLRDRAEESSRARLAAEISHRILSGREVKLP